MSTKLIASLTNFVEKLKHTGLLLRDDGVYLQEAINLLKYQEEISDSVKQQLKEATAKNDYIIETSAKFISLQRALVYEQISSERNYQDAKWGTVEDHPHEVGGWITLMRKLLQDAEVAWASSNGDQSALHEIRKVLAVGVSCGEQHGLPGRTISNLS